MKNCFCTLLSALAICLLLVATSAYFKNTEAFLNGRNHFDKSSHHDYDKNGKKDSTHHKHGSPVAMIKLNFVPQLSRLVVEISPLKLETSAFITDGLLKTEEYKSVIFRPPILA